MSNNTLKSTTGFGSQSVQGWEEGTLYFKPASGIPKNDFVQGVKNSLNLADSSLQPRDIVDNVNTQASNKPLSARAGYELQEEINNLKARGRFLSLWNCVTGLPKTIPATVPYLFNPGDYFIVSTIGETNYMPFGAYYTGIPSSTIDSESPEAGDFYQYDGTSWLLVKNNQKEISFANIAGNPEDNQALSSALDGKANVSHDHTISDVTGLQAALDGKANVVHSHDISDVTGLQSSLDNKVPTSRTVNGKALSSNINLIASDIGINAISDSVINALS